MKKHILFAVILTAGATVAFAQSSDAERKTSDGAAIPKAGTLKPLTKDEEVRQKLKWYESPVSGVGQGDREALQGQATLRPMVQAETMPEYSKEALKARTQGTVKLTLVVNERGMPENIAVVEPLDGLSAKAVEAARKWRWRPGYMDGQKVACKATIEFNFKLVHGTPDTTSIKASYELPEKREAAKPAAVPAKAEDAAAAK